MADRSLVPHPDCPAAAAAQIVTAVGTESGSWLFDFELIGTGQLVLPAPAPPRRADGLWERTCFELFLRQSGREDYLEFNFSPSGEWAAYSFDGYLAGMRELVQSKPPRMWSGSRASSFLLRASLASTEIPSPPWRLGLSAIVEEQGGRKSYWALAHPPGEPDFHDPDCFALELPAPDAP